MKKVLKIAVIAGIASALAFLIAVKIVDGAPSASIFRNILPEVDSTYDIGSPTMRWLRGFFDNATTTKLTIDGLNCTGSSNGGALTTDASGNVSCSDDDSGSGGTGSVGTSSPGQIGNLSYWTTSGATPELLGTVATGTISAGTGITLDSSTRSAIGGALQITNSGVTSVVAGSGIGVSGATGAVTISNTRAGNSIATSSAGVIGNLLYFSSAGATPELVANTATTSLTATSPLSLSQPISVIGSSASILSVSTAGDWTGTFDGQEGSWYIQNSYASTSADYWLTTKSTTNLSEGTNLYYTDARARAALSATSPLSYDSGTGVFSFLFNTFNTWTNHNIFSSLFAINASSTNGTTTSFAITSLLSKILKTDASGNVVGATADTDYQVPLTFGDGLTRTVNDVDCDTASGSVFGCLAAADWTTFNSKESALTFTYPLTRATNTISLAFGTTTANTWAELQTFSSGVNVGGTTFTALIPTTRSLTIAGTANQLTSSAGAQDLSANRTWTLSLPNHVIFPSSFQASEASTTNATTTSLSILAGLYDVNASSGTNGEVLQTTGTGIDWVSTTTLGIHEAVTLTGESYLSLSNQQITASAVNLGTTNVSGTLPLTKLPEIGAGFLGNPVGSIPTTPITIGGTAVGQVPRWGAGVGGSVSFGALDLADSDAVTGSLPIGNGGTNATTLGSNMILGYNGTRIVSTSTPEVSHIIATSSTASSTLPFIVGSNSEQGDLHIDANNTSAPGIVYINNTVAGGKIIIGDQAASNDVVIRVGSASSSQSLKTGIQFYPVVETPVTGMTANAIGGQIRPSANVASALGVSTLMQFGPTAAGSSFNVTTLTAQQFRLDELASYTGTVGQTNVVNITSGVRGGAGTFTTLNMLRIADPSYLGSTNGRGLLMTTAAGANMYNLYIQGTAQNYIAGKVGIGTTTPGWNLSVVGNIGITAPQAEVGNDNYLCWDPVTFEVSNGGANCGASSRRHKENISKLSYGLNEVLRLKPVSFTFKESGKESIGFIAEDVVKVLPELVSLDELGRPESVEYDKITAVIVRAVQEVVAKITGLERRIQKLEQQNRELIKRIEELEK